MIYFNSGHCKTLWVYNTRIYAYVTHIDLIIVSLQFKGYSLSIKQLTDSCLAGITP